MPPQPSGPLVKVEGSWSSPEDAQDGEIAYARFPAQRPAPYRDGLLPS